MTFCLLRQQDYDNSCLDLTDSGMTNMYVKGKRCVTIVVIGNVDSGKSTTAGHLLYLKGDLDKSGIVSVFEKAKKLGKDTYKYAWVLDKMKAERKSGNTINAAYGRVDTTNYDCTLIDVPGKPDYLKNTLFGISQADCALLIIDSTTRGFQAGMSSGQTRKHALFAFTLGVKQIICCFNKMDSTIPKYSKTRYEHLVHEVSDLLLKVGFEPHNISFVPISGFNGDNMIEPSANLPWYKGVTLFDAIDKIGAPKRPRSKPLRLPLSDVYNIGEIGTVAVGRVESGVLNPAMAVTFGPTGQTSTVRSVQKYHRSVFEAIPGDHVGFHVDVSFKDIIRGHVASNSNEDPAKGVVSFTCHVIIMNDPGQIGKGFTALMDCHTSHVPVYFGKILSTK